MLPPAVFGLLVVYCLKNVDLLAWSHGIPELIAILFVIILHLSFRKMLLSIAGGTALYCCSCSWYFNATKKRQILRFAAFLPYVFVFYQSVEINFQPPLM